MGEVAAQMPRGSEVGVRRSLARLVGQGIVRAEKMGRNSVHELNRDHIAAPVAVHLAGLRLELWARFRKTLAAWNPKPIYGYVFGSAARGDGDSDSDIDLLLVHPRFPGDLGPRRDSGAWSYVIASIASGLTDHNLTGQQALEWHHQVDDLHRRARAWTGNPLQVVEMSILEWSDHGRRQSSLWKEITRDAIKVADNPSPLLVPRTVASD